MRFYATINRRGGERTTEIAEVDGRVNIVYKAIEAVKEWGHYTHIVVDTPDELGQLSGKNATYVIAPPRK